MDYVPVCGLTLVAGWAFYMILCLVFGSWCGCRGRWMLYACKGLCCAEDAPEPTFAKERCRSCGAPDQIRQLCEYCGSELLRKPEAPPNRAVTWNDLRTPSFQSIYEQQHHQELGGLLGGLGGLGGTLGGLR